MDVSVYFPDGSKYILSCRTYVYAFQLDVNIYFSVGRKYILSCRA